MQDNSTRSLKMMRTQAQFPGGGQGGGEGGMVPPNLEGWDIVACISPKIVGTSPECRPPPRAYSESHTAVIATAELQTMI